MIICRIVNPTKSSYFFYNLLDIHKNLKFYLLKIKIIYIKKKYIIIF